MALEGSHLAYASLSLAGYSIEAKIDPEPVSWEWLYFIEKKKILKSFGRSSSPYTLWVPEMERRLLGLVISVFAFSET